MNVRVLGPLEVDVGDRVATIAARKIRTLLAMLVLHANVAVGVDRLVDAVWPDDPPRTAAKTLQTYVLQLRKLLGDAAIETTPGGYRLRINPSCVDAIEFERIVGDGRRHLLAGEPATASARFAAALALWRGHPYGDLVDVAGAAGPLARLVDLHANTLEDAIDADLALGQHRVLIGRLEALTAEHPLRERLWGQLILALYRSGRQADALRAYQRARAGLADELGIDPGPDLQRLEHAVLVHDPVLGQTGGPHGPATAAVPVTRYARNGDIHLAYQMFGDDGPTILVVPDWYSHVEALWEHPDPVRLLLGLAEFARVVLFDSRGTGMSDPVDLDDRPTLEQWADDARAVLDAAGVDEAFVLGASAGSSVAILLGVTQPRRVRGLILYNAIPAFQAITPATLTLPELVQRFRARWGAGPALDDVAPGLAEDPTALAWLGRYQRLSGSPGRIATRLEMVASIDVRAIARTVAAPTMVIHREGDRICPAASAAELAASIDGSRFTTIPGDEHLWFLGDFDVLLARIEAFVSDDHAEVRADRILASLLALEILGDPDPADTARYEALVARHVDRHRGTVLEGDDRAIVCSFPGPSSAIRCAHAAAAAAHQLGLEVRAGAHTGEVDRDDVSARGAARTITEHVAALADPGELVLTGPVADLAGGAGVDFVDRGQTTVDESGATLRLFAVNL